MNDQNVSQADAATRQEMMSELFAHMVMQQTNLALMMMGKLPNPQSGETVRNLDAAQLFIDQLEMLEAKTKGNLDKNEEKLLKQSLMSLRMAFVEAVETEPAQQTASEPEPEDAAKTKEAKPNAPDSAPSPEPEESHKKFSKKY
jgi:hypothetical protein